MNYDAVGHGKRTATARLPKMIAASKQTSAFLGLEMGNSERRTAYSRSCVFDSLSHIYESCLLIGWLRHGVEHGPMA